MFSPDMYHPNAMVLDSIRITYRTNPEKFMGIQCPYHNVYSRNNSLAEDGFNTNWEFHSDIRTVLKHWRLETRDTLLWIFSSSHAPCLPAPSARIGSACIVTGNVAPVWWFSSSSLQSTSLEKHHPKILPTLVLREYRQAGFVHNSKVEHALCTLENQTESNRPGKIRRPLYKTGARNSIG